MKKVYLVIALMVIQSPVYPIGSWFSGENNYNSTFLAVFYTLYKKLFTYTLTQQEIKTLKDAVENIKNYKLNKEKLNISSLRKAITVSKNVLPPTELEALQNTFDSVRTTVENKDRITLDENQLHALESNINTIKRTLSKPIAAQTQKN